jgi:hypothetical protein
MNFDHNKTLWERELRSSVEKRCGEIIQQLSTGSGVTSIEDYRRLTGYVAAFAEVLEMLDAVRTKLTKQESSR